MRSRGFSLPGLCHVEKKDYLCAVEKFENIKVIAFDADDTLWDCQSHFEDITHRYCALLAPWAGQKEAADSLFDTERKNMPLLGYGTKAFTLSLIENAVKVSGGKVNGEIVGQIVEMGRSLLELPCKPLPEVEPTLAQLYEEGRYRLAAFTKGELLDQENKLRRSGLGKYFQRVEIVSDKTRHEFLSLCRAMRIAPCSLLMVGNSLRSDIAPALAIGAAAIHIPFHVTWALEHADDITHERLAKISHFSEILTMI